MRLVDTRRLTGRNFLLDGVGAAAELAFDDTDDRSAAGRDGMEGAIRAALVATCAPLDLDTSIVVFRRFETGVTVAMPAPLDALMTAADAMEVAIAGVAGVVADDVDPLLGPGLVAERAAERNPGLLALVAEAERRDVPAVVDEDGLTIGLGKRGRTWPLTALPATVDVNWAALGRVPVALVTGTNGKTTTTRLLAAILGATGEVVGATSTDGVVIDGVVVDEGDWSGPGGARLVVRDPRVGLAVLETARGGLLRRGLALEGYDVGVVLNVADDHFGEYGVTDLPTMAEVKALVGRGVRPGGAVVLNGDDAQLMALAATMPAPVVLCAMTMTPIITAHLQQGATAWWVMADDGRRAVIVRGRGQAAPDVVIAVDDVPLTLGGAAAYNVYNALAAAAAASAMGIADDVIAAGLRSLRPSLQDSPGRGNVLRHGGVTLVLDFAHNPAAVGALWGLVRGLRTSAGRVLVSLGAPGDRLDSELEALADAIVAGGPDVVVCRELLDYLRGRVPGAVPALLASRLAHSGLQAHQIVVGPDTDVAGLEDVVSRAVAGDTVIFTPLVDQAGVVAWLRAAGWPVD